jgi:hypothetical protein
MGRPSFSVQACLSRQMAKVVLSGTACSKQRLAGDGQGPSRQRRG